MKCDVCKKNEATYHCQTIVNGVSHEEHLCSECAKDRNISFGNMVQDMFSHDSIFGGLLPLMQNFLPCDCGTTFDDIASSGMVGCNNCNTHYKGLIADAMKNISIGAENELSRQKNMSDKDKKINKLREEISLAVEKEDYETASKLKKEIDKLNSEEK